MWKLFYKGKQVELIHGGRGQTSNAHDTANNKGRRTFKIF